MKQPTAIAIVILALASLVYAQADTAAITGQVTDPTGAVVVGAQVTVANTDTNLESVTQTNAEGMYRIQPLRPGPYRVTVVAAGFKRSVREGLVLRLGNTMALNPGLEVGAVAESVEITAVALQETRGWHWMTSYGSYLREAEYAVRKLGLDWLGIS